MINDVFQYSIPILHPVIVHFPVALCVMGLIFCAGWLIRNQPFWLNATTWVLGPAFLGAILALRTGEAMEEQSEGVAMVDEFVHLHETFAERTTWLLGIAFVWLLVARWLAREDVTHSGSKLWVRWLAFVLVLATAIMMGFTGHIGGIMTWGV